MKQQEVWRSLHDEEKELEDFCGRYRRFLSACKTERLVVKYILEQAKGKGFVGINELETQQGLGVGRKVYWVHQDKVVLMAVIGKESLEQGINLIGAHTDAPRLDLKPNPIYEAKDLAMAKTHYYGGIKKYQWVGMPLALHGVVFLADGTKVELSIGENEDQPVFTVTDLLPHLAQKQMEKKASEAIEGEGLNILLGSIPILEGEAKELVKTAILQQLEEQYCIKEEDLVSAELEVVPAGPARDVGLDRSMIGGYGQDDRSCSFALLEAILEQESPEKTAVALFVDKEEIGSTGSTGAKSEILPYFLMELAHLIQGSKANDPSSRPLELLTRRCLFNSKALSADVSGADDPNYDGVMEKNNAAKLGRGVVLTKYTGVKGKAGASDANAEFVSYVRRLFNQEQIPWQASELGQVDAGGGGTIAMFLAQHGMEIVDCGPALLSMHAPFEIVSKADLYITYKAYSCFFRK